MRKLLKWISNGFEVTTCHLKRIYGNVSDGTMKHETRHAFAEAKSAIDEYGPRIQASVSDCVEQTKVMRQHIERIIATNSQTTAYNNEVLAISWSLLDAEQMPLSAYLADILNVVDISQVNLPHNVNQSDIIRIIAPIVGGDATRRCNRFVARIADIPTYSYLLHIRLFDPQPSDVNSTQPVSCLSITSHALTKMNVRLAESCCVDDSQYETMQVWRRKNLKPNEGHLDIPKMLLRIVFR